MVLTNLHVGRIIPAGSGILTAQDVRDVNGSAKGGGKVGTRTNGAFAGVGVFSVREVLGSRVGSAPLRPARRVDDIAHVGVLENHV